MKPIPLSAYCDNFVPPITGFRGSSTPHANSFDPSGNFQSRPRVGSANKRPWSEEIDLVYDLNAEYPPLVTPAKQGLNVNEIKKLLVDAVTAGQEARAVLDQPDTDPKLKAFGNLSLSLLSVVSAMVETGIVPLATATQNAEKKSAPPTSQKPEAGVRELKEALLKADREAVIFYADLGKLGLANRTALANAFSAGLRAKVVENAKSNGQDPAEAIRVTDDALSCVSDMEFIGTRSERAKDRSGAEKTFFTMPVKVKFEDRDARINFEKQVKNTAGLRAVMSLPKPIRVEQSAFQKALRDRYKSDFIMVKPDPRTLRLISFRKEGGEGKWFRGEEELALPPGIMLPGYKAREAIVLTPEISVAEPTLALQMES
jgi:hypothetical protein